MSGKIDVSLLYATVSYGGIVDLSPKSRAIALTAVALLHHRYRFQKNNAPINDTEWDTLDGEISLALDEIMSSIVGMIIPAIFTTPSISKFIPCDGGIYNKSDYPALYDVIDSQFIVNSTQFTVPDLRDKFLAGAGGNYPLGHSAGTDDVVLTQGQLPAHSHLYSQYTFGIDIESVGVPDPTGVGQPALAKSTGLTGDNEPHENRPPFVAVRFYIVAE